MVPYLIFAENLANVQARMAAACAACGRTPDAVKLLPVTKNHPVEAVEYAVKAGLSGVGENRVQEAQQKHSAWSGEASVRWELIGHLQSNKARQAVEVFDRVQSVDSEKLLRKLDTAAGEAGKTLAVLLQVNAGEDAAKYGVACAEAEALLAAALGMENLRVEGLMTIAPLGDEAVAARAFARLRETRDRLETACGVKLPELSMGMTGDLEAAIKEGSTQIRIGTALYGERQY